MAWRPLYGRGALYELSSIGDGPGRRKARAFLNEIANEFTGRSKLFYDVMGWLPFTFRERQTHSILLPAIAAASQATVVELPIWRKYGRGKRHGFLDYWVYHKSVLYLLEVKHSFLSVRSGLTHKGSHDSWQEAIDQVDKIPLPLIRKDLDTPVDKIFRLALMVMPLWKSSSARALAGTDEWIRLSDSILHHSFSRGSVHSYVVRAR
ncbi:MAG: hypothetical protein V3U49_08370 [Nitrososphaerales archaeon]